MGLLLFAPSELEDGLISYWEGGSVRDRMHNNLLTVGVDAPTFASTGGKGQGKATYAAHAYLTRVHASCVRIDFALRSFTVAAWVNSTALPGTGGQLIIGKGGTTTAVPGFRVRLYAPGGGVTRATANIVDNDTTSFAVNGTSDLSGWAHIAVVVNRSSNTIKLYVNKVLEATTSIAAATSVSGTSDLLLGLTGDGGDAQPLGFIGAMSGIGIWRRALSQNSLNSLYNRGSGLRGF